MQVARRMSLAVVAILWGLALQPHGVTGALMSSQAESTDNTMQAGFWAAGIDATVDILPDVLNFRHERDQDDSGLDITGLPLHRNWYRSMVLAFIELPSGFDVGDIVVSSVELTAPGGGTVSARHQPTHIGDYDDDGVPDLMVSFRRGEVRQLLRYENGLVTLTVSGTLTTGQSFSGSDTVTVIGKEHPPHGDDDDDDEDDEEEEEEDDDDD